MNGRKHHLVVDALGLLLVLVVHAANTQDDEGIRQVLQKAHLKLNCLHLMNPPIPAYLKD